MRRLLPLVLLFTVGAAIAASGAVVRQKGRVFSSPTISVKAGETVTFQNDDDVVHSIYTVVGAKNVNLVQQPGETAQINFPTAGDYTVKCAIHPTMLLTVKAQ